MNIMIDPFTISTGYLSVGDGHEIYWEEWGNPQNKTPYFFLHGGPGGGGFTAKHKSSFNPEMHRVIFHDQRGCGQSRFSDALISNTTQHLISDIEYLREHLEIKKLHIIGGSWGSTLGLTYAIEYPKRVETMILSGIFLARNIDAEYLYGGYSSKHNYPKAWKRFTQKIPGHDAINAKKAINYYNDKMHEVNHASKEIHAIEWALFESSLLALDYNERYIELELRNDVVNTLAQAKLGLHYFVNNCFLKDDFILHNSDSLNDIPITIIHGRQDAVCPPSAAIDLHEQTSRSELYLVPGGHRKGSGDVERTIMTLLQEQNND